MSRIRHAAGWPVAALLSLVTAPALALVDQACYRMDTDTFKILEGCKRASDGTLIVSETALAQLEYDADGLAAVIAGKHHYYLRRDGRHLAVITYDSGPDYFEEGLARAWVDGQIGYYDRQLQPAFAARFDWGWPFKDGIAEVCQDCAPGKPDAGGHTAIEGGKHYRIDRQGNILP